MISREKMKEKDIWMFIEKDGHGFIARKNYCIKF